MEGGALSLWPLETEEAEAAAGHTRFRLEPAPGLVPVAAEDPVGEALERCGRAPLPPYIHRPGDEDPGGDRDRYQTVYARAPGAVAAPTAGLHFTQDLLARIEALGVRRVAVTLHVGEGTFAPVRTERLEEHVMHAERYVLDGTVADAVAAARAEGGRVFAVGTTSVRTLETCAVEGPHGAVVEAGSGATRLFLHPNNPPRVVDALLTNFHLPGSTLIALVASFLGLERTLALYREAIGRGYRFFSYGDAMLVLP